METCETTAVIFQSFMHNVSHIKTGEVPNLSNIRRYGLELINPASLT